jgi:cyanophycin synthetase
MLNKDQYYTWLIYYLRIKEIIQDKLLNKDKNTQTFQAKRVQYYHDLWHAAAHQLGAKIKDYDSGYFKIELKDKWTMVQDSNVMTDDFVTFQMAGNKPLILKLMTERNYPIPKHHTYKLSSLKNAFNVLKKWQKPVVVKPAIAGSAGKGITTGITTYDMLKKASYEAAFYGPKLLFEEQIEGDSYRLLYINGKYTDAILKKRPRITGDGKSSIKKLIDKENIRRITSEEIIALHPIAIDLELKYYLEKQDFNLHTVLPKDKSIEIKRVINQTTAHESYSVFNEGHKEIIALGSEISNYLNIKFCGIDLITKDITKPLDKTDGVINEVNTTPGIHHSYLISQKERTVPVALELLKYLLTSN